MIRSTSSWLAATLAGAALLAGCGSSSSSTSSSSTSSSTPSTAATSTSTSTTTTGAGAASSAAGAEAVAACKKAAQSDAALSTSEKSELEGICGHAASGTASAVHQTEAELCTAIAKSPRLPAAAKEQALAACKAETQK